jgi:hypothetical protein
MVCWRWINEEIYQEWLLFQVSAFCQPPLHSYIRISSKPYMSLTIACMTFDKRALPRTSVCANIPFTVANFDYAIHFVAAPVTAPSPKAVP